MVFIDADKMNYKEYYERSLKLLDKGGLIIVDNVLWHGEVADDNNLDKFTVNIRDFNTYVANDKRVEQIIVPLGDGMTVCRVVIMFDVFGFYKFKKLTSLKKNKIFITELFN